MFWEEIVHVALQDTTPVFQESALKLHMDVMRELEGLATNLAQTLNAVSHNINHDNKRCTHLVIQSHPVVVFLPCMRAVLHTTMTATEDFFESFAVDLHPSVM